MSLFQGKLCSTEYLEKSELSRFSPVVFNCNLIDTYNLSFNSFRHNVFVFLTLIYLSNELSFLLQILVKIIQITLFYPN